jgi:hypothetical protein
MLGERVAAGEANSAGADDHNVEITHPALLASETK